MKNSNAIFQIIIVVLGAILALTMGLQVGTQDYRTLILWFLIGGAGLYVLQGYKYTWQLIILVSMLGFSMRPMGFELNTAHFSFLLAATMGLLTLFRNTLGGRRVVARAGLGGLELMMFIWIVYGGIHFVANYVWPVYPTEWSTKHSLTRYFLAFAGPCVFLWYSLFPKGIDLGKHWLRTVLYIIAGALVTNVLVRFYLVFGLGLEMTSDRGNFYQEEGMVYIPIINLIPGVEVLRIMGPLSTGFAYCLMVHSKWMRAQSIFTKLVVYCTFGLGIFGSLFSAGRAAVIVAVLYVFIFALMKRRFFHLGAGIGLAMTLFVFANLASRWVKSEAPFAISRSLQYLLVDRGGEAERSIRSSTDWRSELFDRSIDEWHKDDRVFWTGRATLSFSAEDTHIRDQYGGFEAAIQTALRRGATHNLVTDLLVQYGLIGLLLFYLMSLLLIRFIWRARRYCREDLDLDVFSCFLLVSLPLSLLYKSIGASFFEVFYYWMVVIMIVGMRTISVEENRARAADQAGGEGRQRRVVSPGREMMMRHPRT